ICNPFESPDARKESVAEFDLIWLKRWDEKKFCAGGVSFRPGSAKILRIGGHFRVKMTESG
ncbi:MAG: hypothetical protein JZU67_04820, partial [Burkholderiaceae bacterium]|nr:hypothetical protein [Burkholderiaceae bacterium]